MVKYELGGISSLLKIATNRSSVSGARSEARVPDTRGYMLLFSNNY